MPNITPSNCHNNDSSIKNNLYHQLRNEHPSATIFSNSTIPNLGTIPPVVINVQEATQISQSLNNERSRIQDLLQLGDLINCGTEDTTELTLSRPSSANVEANINPFIELDPPSPDEQFDFNYTLCELGRETTSKRNVRFLFTGGVRRGLSPKTSNLLLAHAIAKNLHNSVARSIAEYRVDVNARHNGLTPLMLTAHYQNASAAKILLTPNLFNWTLDNDFHSFNDVHYSFHPRTDNAYLASLNVNERDSNDFSALMMWIENGNTEIAELLISRGADITKDLQVAVHGNHTKVLAGLVELLLKNDPDDLLSLNKWMEKKDSAMATALYPYVGITKANLDEAAGNFRISTLQFFTSLLKEKSILAIDYLRAKHPVVADYLQMAIIISDWHTLDVVKSSTEYAPGSTAGGAPAEVRSHVDQLSPEVIQSIQNFENHKDFERLGAMRKSLVSFAQHQANSQPSVAMEREWEKI